MPPGIVAQFFDGPSFTHSDQFPRISQTVSAKSLDYEKRQTLSRSGGAIDLIEAASYFAKVKKPGYQADLSRLNQPGNFFLTDRSV